MSRITYALIAALIAIFICFFASCPSDPTDGGDQPTAEPTTPPTTEATSPPTEDPTAEPTTPPTTDPTPDPTAAIGIINFEAAQQANIVFFNYGEIPPSSYTIYDSAWIVDDSCQLTFSYDITNYWDGSTALNTNGKLITNLYGDDASHAICQIIIELSGWPIGTSLLCSGMCSFNLSSKTVTGNVYVPPGSPINACSIILLNSGGGQTATNEYASMAEGWNQVSYGFDALGKVISINGVPVGPFDHEPAFNIGNVICVQFRLAGPTSANGISGSANCTIDSISW